MSEQPGMLKVMEQIKKLLSLAAKNPNEHEAAAAAAKAQELLTRYNLDTATIEKNTGESGKRAKEAVDGGFYRFEREVWEAVAQLNFCLYWNQKVRPPGGLNKYREHVRYVSQHRVVGRLVNIRTTINMAQYLLSAINRVTREICDEKKLEFQSNWARSFREGVAYRITNKLEERRDEIIDREEREQQAAEDRAAKAGVSFETALTVAAHTQNERDENYDFIYEQEPGTRARKRAEAAAEARRKEEAYTRWAAANPEEARKLEEEEQEKLKKAANRRGSSRGGGDWRYGHVNPQAFWTGDKAGDKIGLDQQMDSGDKVAGRLT